MHWEVTIATQLGQNYSHCTGVKGNISIYPSRARLTTSRDSALAGVAARSSSTGSLASEVAVVSGVASSVSKSPAPTASASWVSCLGASSSCAAGWGSSG